MDKIMAVAAHLAQQREDLYLAKLGGHRNWTRTDTARWLNDRSERVLAWARRKLPRPPVHCRQMGYWLRAEATPVFDRAHACLTGLTSGQREAIFIEEVLR